MWAAPVVFFIVSVVLWRYAGAVFMPKLLAERFLELLPLLDGAFMQHLAFYNFLLIYFGAYLLFAVYWDRMKRFLRHPFLAAFALWGVNLFVIFPIAGRGIIGYRMPQGPFSASVFLFVSHWLFARMLQRQERLQNPITPAPLLPL